MLLLNTKDANPNFYIPLSIEQALRAHPDVAAVHNVDYHNAIPTALAQDCNLLVAVDGEGLDRGVCHRLRVLCGRSVLWVSEDPYDRQFNLQNAPLFDHVFTNDSASAGAYDGRALHLPFAANPRFHELPIPGEAEESAHYLYDLLFIGTAWPNRVQFLQELLRRIPGVKAKLALPSNEHLPRPDLGLPASCYSWRAANREVARLANRSRIVLTLHRNFAVAGNDSSAATPGPRLFETALAGGFQLVEATLPEVAEYYTPQREVALFDDIADCTTKIRHYLAHPGERLDFARAAQQRTRHEHLYAHRVARLLAVVDEAARCKTPAVATPSTAISSAAGSTAASTSVPRKKRLLFVIHNHISLGNFGGVEVYVDLLARNMPDDMEPVLYFPDRSVPEARLVRVLDVRKGTSREIRFATPNGVDALSNAERDHEFGRLLHDERIDLVHFHHMMGHPWSLPLVARTLGIPTVTTVEDYYASCSILNLINPMRRYCRAMELPEDACDMCLQEGFHHRLYGGALTGEASRAAAAEQQRVGPGSQASRRSYVASVLDAHDLIIFISQAAHDITRSLLPILPRPGQTVVEPLPIANEASPQARREITAPLHVAVPGNLSVIKGGDAMCRIFHAMRDDPVEFHVFGRIDTPFDDILKTWNLPKVHIRGGYRPQDSSAMLATCDVALMLSMWPETYVLTLSEAWRAGVVPIVTDIGALGERVKHNVNGFKVPVDEPSAVVHKLRDIVREPWQLRAIRRNINENLYRLLDDHLAFLVGNYRRLMEQYRVDERAASYYDEAPHPRKAGGGRAFHLSPSWHIANGCESGDSLNYLQNMRTPSLVRRAQRYLRDHGVRKTMRRAVHELLLRQGIRLP